MKTVVLILLLAIAARAETFTVTAYCGCAVCCGKANQPTASGKLPREGVTVAGPRRMPFGTKLLIEGVGERVVQDRLAIRYDRRIDIYFSKHSDAKKFGIQKLNVTIK